VETWKLSEKHKEKCYSLPEITAGNTSEAYVPLMPSSYSHLLPILVLNVTVKTAALCFILGRSLIQISAQRQATLVQVFTVSAVPSGKFQDSTKNYVTTPSFHIHSNSLLTYYPTIRHYIVYDMDSIFK
jgi:hypothetical protein